MGSQLDGNGDTPEKLEKEKTCGNPGIIQNSEGNPFV